MLVQQHVAPAVGLHPGIQPDPKLATYPQALAAHQEVVADADLFHSTLRQFYDAMGMKVFKVMKLGGQELNLHLLYERVTAAGGAEQVIKDKHWRDVGEAFHLPKTITSVSFVLKRGYMIYLWDYEQVYFHRQGGQPRKPPPAARHLKDHSHTHGLHHATHHRHLSHPPPASLHVMPPHAIHDAAAAMAAAAIRGRQDWAAAAFTHNYGGTMPLTDTPKLEGAPAQAPPAMISKSDGRSSAGIDGATAQTLKRAPSVRSLNTDAVPSVPSSAAMPSQEPATRAAASSGHNAAVAPATTASPLHLSALTAPFGVQSAVPDASIAVGQAGSIRVTASLGAHGMVVSGTIGGMPIHGVLAYSPLSASGDMSSQQASLPSATATGAAAAKRRRVEGSDPAAAGMSAADGDTRLGANEAHVRLPDSDYSLLMRICGVQASARTQEAAAKLWLTLGSHERDMVRNAVSADEERYRAEERELETGTIASAARHRYEQALRAAEETVKNRMPQGALTTNGYALGSSEQSDPAPEPANGGLPHDPVVSAALAAAPAPSHSDVKHSDTPPKPPKDDLLDALLENWDNLPDPGINDDLPLSGVFDPAPGHTRPPASLATYGYASTAPSNVLQRDLLGPPRGPVASPNVGGDCPLDPARHWSYGGAPAFAGSSTYQLNTFNAQSLGAFGTAQDEAGTADRGLDISWDLDLTNPDIDMSLPGDFMLEEPP